MREGCLRRVPERLLSGLLVALLLFAWAGHGTAQATDARLEEADNRREERQTRLDELYQLAAQIESDAERLEIELTDLLVQEESRRAETVQEADALALRVRETYMNGSSDPGLALLASDSTEQAGDRARMLGLLAVRSRGDLEDASAAFTRTQAAADRVRLTQDALAARRAELAAVTAEAQQLVAEAEAAVDAVGDAIAAEEAARLEREGRSGRYVGPGGPAGRIVGNIACPVGGNPQYRDTWGAPRSGGRSHKGTDIMEARGVPIHAYENGVIIRKTGGGLGGTSLYLRGDSGNVYYYTHLSGYVSGIEAGIPVTVGQHIAFNGDTGNARGIPHLHFEVKPGGGGSVNPYPYVLEACG